MDTQTSPLWKKVLAEIETEVSRANYLTLFKNTTLLSLHENVLTIAVPSTMVIDLIQRRFYPILKKACDKHTKQNIEIVFIPKVVSYKNGEEDKEAPLFSSDSQRVHELNRVRPEFTFDTLAVSGSNQLAFISAQTVAKNIGGSYNPLFIYGPVGVGKTHLMQAVANEVFSKDHDKKIIYITSEEFTNEVVDAIRTNQTQSMKKKFRNASLLLIDDVQFIAGKDRVQEELFHTFNILIDKGCQIVLSSDRPPHEIKKLESRLTSRFSGGLTVDIESPDFELRTAILLIKARKFGVDLPMDVAQIIAEHVLDTRSLEGALLRVITESKTKQIEITSELAKKALGNKLDKPAGVFRPEDVIQSVCSYYLVKPTQLKGPKRDASLVKARQTTMFLLKKELGLTFSEIGNLLGGRDHTTIMHGVEKIETLMATHKKTNDEILGISKIIKG